MPNPLYISLGATHTLFLNQNVMEDPTNPTDQFKGAVGSPPPAAPANPEATKPDLQAKPAEPPKEAAAIPVPPVTPPEAPANPPEEHDWKKRYDGTAKDLKEKADDYERAISANVKLVEKDSDNLDTLAETDPKMAEQVSQKLYGKSLEGHREDERIEELRSTDPGRADVEERLSKLENEKRVSQKADRTKFLTEKGIMENIYDEKYKKFDAQFKVLDKGFVENNHQRALEIAFDLAFGKTFTEDDVKKAKEETLLAAQAGKEGGGVPTEGGGSKIPMSPEAKAFNAKLKG